MRFSLYSEIQLHPGKTPEQLYAEVLEQIENADRLGYDVLRRDRALLLPEVLDLGEPDGALRRRGAAHEEHPLPHDAARAAVPQPDRAGVRRSTSTDILTGGRYEWGVGRGHGWIPPKAGVPLDEHARPRYEEAVDLLLRGARQRALLARTASTSTSTTRTSSRSSEPQVPRLPRRHLRPHVRRSPPSAAGASPCRRSCRTWRSRSSSTSTARKCAEHGTEPDIVWIHACHLDEDRETALREARDWVDRLHPAATARR